MDGDDHASLGEAAGEGSLGHTWRRGSDHVRVEQGTEAGGTGRRSKDRLLGRRTREV